MLYSSVAAIHAWPLFFELRTVVISDYDIYAVLIILNTGVLLASLTSTTAYVAFKARRIMTLWRLWVFCGTVVVYTVVMQRQKLLDDPSSEGYPYITTPPSTYKNKYRETLDEPCSVSEGC